MTSSPSVWQALVHLESDGVHFLCPYGLLTYAKQISIDPVDYDTCDFDPGIDGCNLTEIHALMQEHIGKEH